MSYALHNPATGKDPQQLVSCVKTFTASVLEGDHIRKKCHEITYLNKEIALLKEVKESYGGGPRRSTQAPDPVESTYFCRRSSSWILM